MHIRMYVCVCVLITTKAYEVSLPTECQGHKGRDVTLSFLPQLSYAAMKR